MLILKRQLYFLVANYFRWLASFQLHKWHPRIIVITGSSGKTTLLHLLESQLGNQAKYSHLANSAFGIPFDILGLKRQTLTKDEWLKLLIQAPFKAFNPSPKQSIYVVEADCDRPHEGQFLASFLQPEVTIWLNVSRSHTANFDTAVANGQYPAVDEAIAHEFGYFLQYCQKLAIVNTDLTLIDQQLPRTKAEILKITKAEYLTKYHLTTSSTEFILKKDHIIFNYLLPQDTFYAIAACQQVCQYLNQPFNPKFPDFSLPPGRSSIFDGLKNTTLVDSSYNANLSSMIAVLEMFDQLPAKNKWLVLSDMTEQGSQESVEHQKLADVIAKLKVERVILMGPRMIQYTYPVLVKNLPKSVALAKLTTPKEVLDYLTQNIEGGETILFKGARFLEGVVEHLLADPAQASLLARREKIWQIRRQQWQI